MYKQSLLLLKTADLQIYQPKNEDSCLIIIFNAHRR